MRATHTPTLGRLLSTTIVAMVVALTGCISELEIDEMDHIEPFDDGSNLELQGVYNCTERGDTGYTRGSRFNINVVKVDDRDVEVNTANAYIAMQDAARRDGVSVRIVSGFRTNADQQRLYSCYTNCNCNSCNLAARPGYSNHQSGHALDLNTSSSGVLNWLNRNGSRFGFRRTVPSEAWHWEWWGNESDFAGPCGRNTNVAPDSCDVVHDGDVIDEDSSCVELGGPSQYLRSVTDQHADGGELVWTGATANSNASNYGQYWVRVPEAGRYKLEVWVNRNFATSQQAKYSVRHNGRTDLVTMNYTTAGGWRSLGEFQFSGVDGERVRLDDNTGERSALARKLVFDGLRVTRMDGTTTTTPPPSTPPPATPTCTSVRVETGGAVLNVRPQANTSQSPRGTLANGETAQRISTVNGQEVRGDRQWYEVSKGGLRGFISASYATCVN